MLCSLPLDIAIWWAFQGDLGVNPVETLTHHTGQWAIRFLLLTLAMTPLQRALHQAWPIHLRRQIGLWSFFYALSHFSLFLVLDLEFNLGLLGEEIAERPYITVGFSALVLLLPLALTSTNGWQRRLKRRWKTLHRLIYPAAALACLHALWKGKVLEPEFLAYTATFVVFMVQRYWPTRRIPLTQTRPPS